MSYRRRYSGVGYRGSSNPTTVTIHWSTKSSAYAIKFNDTYHWDQMQIFIQYLKNIPYGERDYDPDNKIWYITEQHLPNFRNMMEMIPEHFKIDFQGKPENQAFTGKFVSVDTYLDKFKELTTTDLRGQEYTLAKKIYRRAALSNHPDRNNGDGSKMAEINECWSNIERLYFNQKKEPEYAIS